MRKLPNVKTIQFYGKTQYLAFMGFISWLGLHEDTVVLMISIEQDSEEKETPYRVMMSYESL